MTSPFSPHHSRPEMPRRLAESSMPGPNPWPIAAMPWQSLLHAGCLGARRNWRYAKLRALGRRTLPGTTAAAPEQRSCRPPPKVANALVFVDGLMLRSSGGSGGHGALT